MSRYRNGGNERRMLHQHAVLISEGDEPTASNFVAVFGPLEWDELLALTSQMFGDGAFEVVVESDTARPVEEHLIAAGWACVEEEIAMVMLAIPRAAPEAPPELTITPVRDTSTYEDYMTVVPGNRAWVPGLAAATDPSVGLIVGYADDKPVATARLACYGDVAEITGVQTLVDFRRRGYGTALTWAAIREAEQRGSNTIVLTATEMGYPLYLKMGFQEVCNYRSYEQP